MISVFLQAVQGCVFQNSLENMDVPKEGKRYTDVVSALKSSCSTGPAAVDVTEATWWCGMEAGAT